MQQVNININRKDQSATVWKDCPMRQDQSATVWKDCPMSECVSSTSFPNQTLFLQRGKILRRYKDYLEARAEQKSEEGRGTNLANTGDEGDI